MGCDDFYDNWKQGHGDSSPFKDFDMLAEPEPRWPGWLERWYRQPWLPPKPSSLSLFNAALRSVYNDVKLHEQLIGSEFRIPIKRGPSATQLRSEAEQLIGSEFRIPGPSAAQLRSEARQAARRLR